MFRLRVNEWDMSPGAGSSWGIMLAQNYMSSFSVVWCGVSLLGDVSTLAAFLAWSHTSLLWQHTFLFKCQQLFPSMHINTCKLWYTSVMKISISFYPFFFVGEQMVHFVWFMAILIWTKAMQNSPDLVQDAPLSLDLGLFQSGLNWAWSDADPNPTKIQKAGPSHFPLVCTRKLIQLYGSWCFDGNAWYLEMC